MVLVSAVRDYINRMLQDISGMKVLVLDPQTHNSLCGKRHKWFRIVNGVPQIDISSILDFVAVDPYHFTLNIPSNHIYMLPAVVDPSGLQQFSDRVVDESLYQQESGLFDFRRTEAMVHESIGIQDNKVDLRSLGKFPKDQAEIVLSSEQDAFFKAMYENFGDIGMNIKRMVDDFLQVAKINALSPAEDMAKFVDNYPEYQKMHGNVSKHVTLVTEMRKTVEERKLMLVSETEQEWLAIVGKSLLLR
ncbi:hypothetical protein GH714_021132 [Hevea brasiliensis]|uniref:Uncharacterized protein n=1 Tax=Hevea brasiliensis TaxID=3981 RepID=A0A6A6KRL8_HEVBR|nr:hypothetical protein GH714_021132 [Hevea brasiliensis]